MTPILVLVLIPNSLGDCGGLFFYLFFVQDMVKQNSRVCLTFVYVLFLYGSSKNSSNCIHYLICKVCFGSNYLGCKPATTISLNTHSLYGIKKAKIEPIQATPNKNRTHLHSVKLFTISKQTILYRIECRIIKIDHIGCRIANLQEETPKFTVKSIFS